jgi:hypothetical protein
MSRIPPFNLKMDFHLIGDYTGHTNPLPSQMAFTRRPPLALDFLLLGKAPNLNEPPTTQQTTRRTDTEVTQNSASWMPIWPFQTLTKCRLYFDDERNGLGRLRKIEDFYDFLATAPIHNNFTEATFSKSKTAGPSKPAVFRFSMRRCFKRP